MFSGGFPGGFFGMGGMGGMGAEGMDQESEEKGGGEVDNQTYYKELEIEQTATIDQVKKAFRKLAMKYHPDKPGGSAQKFKKIKEAYDVLGNPEKKDLYDKWGKEGVEAGGNPRGGKSLFDMFNGGGNKPKGPQKGKPKLVKLEVTLEQVYEGCTKKVKHPRVKLCEACDGKGGKGRKDCGTCKGGRYIERVVQMGPGMYTSSRGPCPACKAQGFIMDPKDVCKACKGRMIVEQEKELEVAIEQGCPHEKDYIFTGESDELPGMMAADLYVRVFIKPHPYITRKGADLFMKKKINLLEALSGITFQFKHLDGRMVQASSFKGETIAPNSLKTLKRLGMPCYKNVMANGNFYIQFEVEFPKTIAKEQRDQLRELLPKSTDPKAFDVARDDVHMLEEFDERELNSNVEGGQREEEEDDEQGHVHGRARQVQCAVQ